MITYRFYDMTAWWQITRFLIDWYCCLSVKFFMWQIFVFQNDICQIFQSMEISIAFNLSWVTCLCLTVAWNFLLRFQTWICWTRLQEVSQDGVQEHLEDHDVELVILPELFYSSFSSSHNKNNKSFKTKTSWEKINGRSINNLFIQDA